MADDLDQELLGLADGGDESDEESIDDFDRLEQEVGERAPSVEPQASVEKVEDAPQRLRGVAQKVKGRRKRKVRQESEEEDDAASRSPEAALPSSDRELSDGEAAAPGEEEEEPAPLYPYEGKYTSPTDKEYVLSLSEIRREEILAERAEQILRQQQDLALKQIQKHNPKRKASAADLEENANRRTTRPRTEKRTALDDYKRAREEKGAAQRGRGAPDRDRREERSPSSAGSERDADGESEVEWAAEPERNDEPQADLQDFNRCRVGRTAFAKVCFYPGFEDAIRGCFARVSIGVNRETGQNQYRMTQIKDFTEGKPYQMESANGKPFTTDQYAIVAQGSAEKPWPFHACSDGKFTDAEFDRFRNTLVKEQLRVTPRRFLVKKLTDINNLLNTKFTDELLSQKFAKQRNIALKYDPVHQANIKRKEIQKRRAEAEQQMDEEEIARCDAKLEDLDNEAANGISAVKAKIAQTASPAKPLAQHESLAQLNRKNRVKTQQEVRQALIAERKKIMKAREAALEKRTAEVKAKVHDKAHVLAQRRSSQHKELFGEATPDTSRAGTPANTASPVVKTRVDAPESNGAKGPIGALKKKNLDDDVIGSLDMDIDIEI